MGFSTEWETTYREGTHLSRWPWSDLVSFVQRYSRPPGPGYRVLELGCGPGANIPFFLSLGADYHAVEGSETAVNLLHREFPSLKEKIARADFTRDIPFRGPFDLIFDRGSVAHNNERAIRGCLELVHGLIKPGACYIGIDWFSSQHGACRDGREAEDARTRTGLAAGPMAGLGRVHFSDQAHLTGLFSRFDIEVLDHKVVMTEIPDRGQRIACWNFVARRR